MDWQSPRERPYASPYKMYFSGSHVKVQLALAKAKKLHDKRQHLKEKAIQQDMRQFHKGDNLYKSWYHNEQNNFVK